MNLLIFLLSTLKPTFIKGTLTSFRGVANQVTPNKLTLKVMTFCMLLGPCYWVQEKATIPFVKQMFGILLIFSKTGTKISPTDPAKKTKTNKQTNFSEKLFNESGHLTKIKLGFYYCFTQRSISFVSFSLVRNLNICIEVVTERDLDFLIHLHWKLLGLSSVGGKIYDCTGILMISLAFFQVTRRFTDVLFLDMHPQILNCLIITYSLRHEAVFQQSD